MNILAGSKYVSKFAKIKEEKYEYKKENRD